MTRTLVVAFMIALGYAVSVSAQAGVTPLPQPCPDCARAGADAAPIRDRIEARNEELQRLRQEQRINDANIRNLREMRLDAARRNDQAAAREYEQSIDDLQADNAASREQQFKTERDIRSLNQELEKIGRAVDECTKRCGMIRPDLPTGMVDSAGPEAGADNTPDIRGVGVPPLRTPPCDDCKDGVVTLENEHKELQRRADRANATRRSEDLRAFEEQRRKVRDLQREVDGCSKQCKPGTTVPTTTSFKDPRVIGGIAGSAALVALLAGGRDSPTSTAGAPVTPQQPPVTTVNPTSPAPAPQPAPAPDAIDSRMGMYVFQTCVCEFDPAGHDASIRLCQSVQQFRLSRTGANTARLDGSAPLFTSDVILDANSQTVDGSAIGVVEASSATLHYGGTFAAAGSPNLTLSLDYGISNATTRYRVTAVKQ
jgi:hypothetical protein